MEWTQTELIMAAVFLWSLLPVGSFLSVYFAMKSQRPGVPEWTRVSAARGVNSLGSG